MAWLYRQVPASSNRDRLKARTRKLRLANARLVVAAQRGDELQQQPQARHHRCQRLGACRVLPVCGLSKCSLLPRRAFAALDRPAGRLC